MDWLNYHHLLYFKVIAEKGSISKASEILKIGQPALSIQLKTFEDHLGIKLFDRVGRGLKLTHEGEVVLEYARKIDFLGKELLNLLRNEEIKSFNSFRLGALDSVPKSLISSLTDFAYEQTGCRFSINEGDVDVLMNLLNNNKIDFALLDFPIKLSHSDDLICQKIYSSPICAFSSKDFVSCKSNFPKSLNSVPCIFPTYHSKLREDLESYFYRKKINPKLIGETQDTSLQKLLALKGDGIVFLPEFSTIDLVKEKKLFNLGKLKGLLSEFFLISKKRALKDLPVDFQSVF